MPLNKEFCDEEEIADARKMLVRLCDCDVVSALSNSDLAFCMGISKRANTGTLTRGQYQELDHIYYWYCPWRYVNENK